MQDVKLRYYSYTLQISTKAYEEEEERERREKQKARTNYAYAMAIGAFRQSDLYEHISIHFQSDANKCNRIAI